MQEASSPLVHLGTGLGALPRKMVEKMESGQYVDFTDLLPARGKARIPSQAFEGQIVVVQALDLAQSRKVIPDLATWIQCFGIYARVVTRKKPEKLPDLLAYMSLIARPAKNTNGLPG